MGGKIPKYCSHSRRRPDRNNECSTGADLDPCCDSVATFAFTFRFLVARMSLHRIRLSAESWLSRTAPSEQSASLPSPKRILNIMLLESDPSVRYAVIVSLCLDLWHQHALRKFHFRPRSERGTFILLQLLNHKSLSATFTAVTVERESDVNFPTDLLYVLTSPSERMDILWEHVCP